MTISHYSYQIPHPHTPPYFIICTVHWAYFVFPPMYTYSCLTFWPHKTSIYLINILCKLSNRHRQIDRHTQWQTANSTVRCATTRIYNDLTLLFLSTIATSLASYTLDLYHPLFSHPFQNLFTMLFLAQCTISPFLPTSLFIFHCSFCKL